MDTIRLSANGHDILFSKKSVMIDGEEYLYTGINAIKHSSAKRVYLFKYEDNWHPLYYSEADANRVDAVFKKIADLNSKRAQAAKALAGQASGQAEGTAAEEQTAGQAEGTAAEGTAAEEQTAGQAEGTAAEGTAAEEQTAEVTSEAGESAAEAPSEENAEETEAGESEKETIPAAERKSKLKKAILIFAIIIVLFIGAGIAYFFVIGPANDASQGPAVDETHQYNDIQEMIEDMQDQ